MPARTLDEHRQSIEESGVLVLVSELALGTPASKGAFVLRDRIQSGLSLAVFVIQTDVTGGTMHTVTYAERDHRIIFCPEPSKSEVGLKQNAGILELIKSDHAKTLGPDYGSVLEALRQQHERLLPTRLNSETPSGKTNMSTDQQLDKFLRQ